MERVEDPVGTGVTESVSKEPSDQKKPQGEKLAHYQEKEQAQGVIVTYKEAGGGAEEKQLTSRFLAMKL